MSAKTVHQILRVFLGLCALHGLGGLFVVMIFTGLCLLEILTGIELLPRRAHGPWILGATLWVMALTLFWLAEVVVCWLYWRRLSKSTIYLAVGLLGLWIIGLINLIAFEITGVVNGLSRGVFNLILTAVICLPCIVLARWMAHTLTHPMLTKDERAHASQE